MNKEEVIKLAREAGLIRTGDGWTEPHRWGMAEIKRFAALVAAAEREGVWNILFEYAGREDLSDSDQSLLKHLAELIRNRGKE